MTLPGFDVSVFNSDLTQTLKGQSFAIAKASEALFADPKFAAHRLQIKAAGIPWGAYHFGQAGSTGPQQAAFFLAHCADAEFLALDAEAAVLKSPQILRDFIAYVKAHDKRQILLYSSRGTWPGDLGQDGNWVADYDGDPDRMGVSPRVIWAIWQKSGSGVDRDVFAGDLAALERLAGRTSNAAPVPPIWTPNPAPNAEVMVSGSQAKPTLLYRLDGVTQFSHVDSPTTFPAPLIAPGWTGILDGGKYAAVRNADLAKGS